DLRPRAPRVRHEHWDGAPAERVASGKKGEEPPGPARPGGLRSVHQLGAGFTELWGDQEGPRQGRGAGAGQSGRRVHEPVGGGRDAEHGGQRRVRRGPERDGPGRRGGLDDGATEAAASPAEAADRVRGLEGAEETGRRVEGDGIGGERREADSEVTSRGGEARD